MAQIIENPAKFSLRYDVNYNNEAVSRLISGLNSGNSNTTPGPQVNLALTNLVTVLSALTRGTLANGRWIYERGVQF